MTTEAFIEAVKEPEQWEAFDPCEGDRGEWFGSSEWTNWSAYQLSGTKFRRIPAPAADSPTEMDAEQATEWLKTPGRAVFSIKTGVFYGSGASLAGDFHFRPFAPLTRGQLAEIERLKEALNAESRLNLKIGLELNATKEQLESALGSQKAALAALEQERNENARLVHKVNALVRCHEKTKSAIREYEIAPIETAGKESGG